MNFAAQTLTGLAVALPFERSAGGKPDAIEEGVNYVVTIRVRSTKKRVLQYLG
jgi:hypothetical protein